MKIYTPLLMWAALIAPAFAGYPSAFPELPQQQNPTQILQEGFGKLRAFFNNGRPRDVRAVERFVNENLAPYFDFDYMTKWAAGSLYNKVSPAQREKMHRYLRQTFLSTLVKNLAGYQSQEIRVSRAKRGRLKRVVSVAAWIKKARGYLVKTNFRFYHTGEAWRIFDVSVGGASAVIHYRHYFQRRFRQNPGPARRW